MKSIGWIVDKATGTEYPLHWHNNQLKGMPMATKIVKTDDLDGTEGAETHSLTLDGETWNVDLTEKNFQKLLKVLEPYMIQQQRQATTAEIREWAISQGMKVPERGRLPKNVIDSFYSE